MLRPLQRQSVTTFRLMEVDANRIRSFLQRYFTIACSRAVDSGINSKLTTIQVKNRAIIAHNSKYIITIFCERHKSLDNHEDVFAEIWHRVEEAFSHVNCRCNASEHWF